MAHKKTILFIEKIFDESFNGEYFKTKVNRTNSCGFWSIEINCSRRIHMINEISNFAWFVGHMYGENVCTKLEGNILIIS